MKLSLIPAVLAVAISAGVAFAQAPLPEVKPPPVQEGPVTQLMDDATITSKVTEAISADPELKDMEFTVDTTDAVVTINGTATARDQIARALAIARTVPGVKSVTNIMGVKTS